MAYADSATITTPLTYCASTVNLTRIVQDLYTLYQNANPNTFENISIGYFDCHTPSGPHFEQIITFTESVSIHVQIALASVYFDYLPTIRYALHGFSIDPNERFRLSSTTVNYTDQSDACSSAEAALTPLCLMNSSIPDCIASLTNPWLFNCSINSTIWTPSDDEVLTTVLSSVLNSWQIGLICGLGVSFFLLLCLFIGCVYRHHYRTKRVTLSREHLFNERKSMGKSVIPHSPTFQQVVHVAESKQSINTTISWIHEGGTNDNHRQWRASRPSKPGSFLDQMATHDTYFREKPPELVSTSTTVVLRPAYRAPMWITSDMEKERHPDELNQVIVDPRQYINRSFTDDNLRDEDAWMSILAVANAELDLLNRSEADQKRMITTL